MDYSYQALETGTGTLVTWTSPTPDPTGAGSGTTVDADSVVQLNCPPPAPGTNGFAWSGVGITGSALPTSVVLGAGLNGAWVSGTGVLTVTGRSILDVYDATTSTLISENVERIYLSGITGTHLLPGMMALSVAQSTIHAPVHGVTTANLAAVTGGLAKPSNSVEVPNGGGLFGWISDYDGIAAELNALDRVLVVNQTNPYQNGIYVWDGTKLTISPELVAQGHMVPVRTGVHWAGTLWSFLTEISIVPSPGAPTDVVWYQTAGVTSGAGWVDLMTVDGPSGASAGGYYLDVDVVASAWNTGEGDHRIATGRAMYHGNAAGDMAELGDDLNSQLGLPWENPVDVRLRVTIDGSQLIFQGWQGITAEDGDPDCQYSIAVKAVIRRAL